MGEDHSKSFTELGVMRLSQFFTINIIGILVGFVLIATAFSLLSYLTFNSFYTISFTYYIIYVTMTLFLSVLLVWLAFSGTFKYYLIAIFLVLYAFCYFPFLSGFCLLGMILLFILLLFYILGSGLSSLLIGSKDFGGKHRLFVITAFFLGITSFISIIINLLWPIWFNDLFLSTVTVQMSASIFLFTELNLPSLTLIYLNITLVILSYLAFFLFIFNLSKRKTTLLIAFVLGVLSPFTFSATGIISLLLFSLCYKDVQGSLHTEKIKPKLKVSCPFCNREIAIESKSCKYCGKVFNIDPDYEKFRV